MAEKGVEEQVLAMERLRGGKAKGALLHLFFLNNLTHVISNLRVKIS